MLVMVATYSRFIPAMMLPSRVTGDLLAGMWQLIATSFGMVPRTLLWDNEAGIGRRGKPSQGVPGFCGTLAVKLIQAPPYDPETKGVVERANGYLRTSFWPGRSFTSPADFNTQIAAWLSLANAREHRVTHRRPVDALAADRAAMAPLPPMPPAVGTTITTRLGRDYYVGVGGSSYSVHPDAIGRMITVRSTLDRVQAFCDHRLMADHPRVWGASALITDPVHVGHPKMLRASTTRHIATPRRRHRSRWRSRGLDRGERLHLVEQFASQRSVEPFDLAGGRRRSRSRQAGADAVLAAGALEEHLDGQRAGEPAGELLTVVGEDFEGNAPSLHRGNERYAHGHSGGLFEHFGDNDEPGVVVDSGQNLAFAATSRKIPQTESSCHRCIGASRSHR